jgi:flagellar biosynthesis chaperone FliJ
MKRRALQTVLRLRHLAVEEAKRVLAEKLAAETEADAQEHAAQSAIRREIEAATALDAGDGVVEAFAAWLPRGQAVLEQARRRRNEAEMAVTQARAALRVARADEAAVERLLATQDAAQATETARREQAAQDETALNRHQRRDD